ncbi:hypothetical protein Q5H92_15115 [Hymenobacter sp. M29]|uniref:Lipoprotein n=1 Tax=Hymenobacter mellowenesis TaxID=3063995 RepID=A0ABT9ADR9_9BACT|nr:hypothetical protein [Hymenobacter sp. M29]MDO7847698.1 hypothetical protein [Hymenobacter sp. M29]
MKRLLPAGCTFHAACIGLIAGGLVASGCSKEKVNCGHGFPTNSFRFQVVDERTNSDWFDGPGRPPVDTLKRLNNNPYGITKIGSQVVWEGGFGNYRALPEGGGDLRNVFLIRVSATDTDTVDVRANFGPLKKSECLPDMHYIQTVEFRYNGRLNDAYDFVGNGKKASFLCAGCGTILVFRKRP